MEDACNETIKSFVCKVESSELYLAGKQLLQRVLNWNKGIGMFLN